MKKFTALLLVLTLALGVTACSSAATGDKIGIILIGDENEGYSQAHIEGIKKAAKERNVEDNLVWFYNVPQEEECYDKCISCIEQGCKLVITNSYGHQYFAKQAAEEHPEIKFVCMTGDEAKKSGLANLSNAFNQTYQSRYVSGVVAGMKIKELVESGKLGANNFDENGKVKTGYVGAFPFAEVISGYTAFFLGMQSIYPDVVMDVSFTSSWSDLVAEKTTAEMLIANGAVIIGQHADTTGAPQACEAANVAGTPVYSVGYNIDMLSVAPHAALTSATNDWSVYYSHCFDQFIKGERIDVDWSEGYESGAVCITKLGDSCAAGTADEVAKAETAIKNGTLHVFDTNKFTVGGQKVTEIFRIDTDGDYVPDSVNGIVDGYFDESKYISAPTFSCDIDGITKLN
ncbi:MAG: BMP family ABC transporter substrate-binding protein [Lachnospiraceae bacterium]|nr:BMP family ABC transporter substrate-binding protein [Lachnospiraceae bacterium]